MLHEGPGRGQGGTPPGRKSEDGLREGRVAEGQWAEHWVPTLLSTVDLSGSHGSRSAG